MQYLSVYRYKCIGRNAILAVMESNYYERCQWAIFILNSNVESGINYVKKGPYDWFFG